MASLTNTGVPTAGGSVNAPGYAAQPENLFFTPSSTDTQSQLINVCESPLLIVAQNIGSAVISVIMCTIDAGGNEYQSPMVLNAKPIVLNANFTALVIDLPGLYRLQTTAFGPTVVGMVTAMSYHSYGLAQYALSNPGV